jgi:2-polyprenyl-3-methyl-5-hydroxy-6-metoxy-1,4-benzoquinol methylase
MQKQICPFCPGASRSKVFSLKGDISVLRCDACGIQFARSYPDYDTADEEIYNYEYFKKAIENISGREIIFNELLAEIEQKIEGGLKRGFLDIGTGEGTILKIAMIRGWERAEGTEISSEAVKFVENELHYKMHQGCLEDLALNENAYDAILMIHVLV